MGHSLGDRDRDRDRDGNDVPGVDVDVGILYALDAQTGDVVWRAALGGAVKGGPAGT